MLTPNVKSWCLLVAITLAAAAGRRGAISARLGSQLLGSLLNTCNTAAAGSLGCACFRLGLSLRF
eukprot:6359654-Amphidinium_carterae.1